MDTPWGPLRVVTATQCVMDRLAGYWHWNDRQSWDQAVLVASHREVDFDELVAYAKDEGADPNDINKLRRQARRVTTRRTQIPLTSRVLLFLSFLGAVFPPTAGRSTTPTCCCSRALARARCSHCPWWPKSSTARRICSKTRAGTRWRAVAKTGTRFRRRSTSTTRPSACCEPSRFGCLGRPLQFRYLVLFRHAISSRTEERQTANGPPRHLRRLRQGSRRDRHRALCGCPFKLATRPADLQYTNTAPEFLASSFA